MVSLLLSAIVIIYVGLVIIHAKELAAKIELETYQGVLQAEEISRDLGRQKEVLDSEKEDLQNEALEIFTLYEITKEITKSLNQEQAFEIFKRKLQNHVGFEECRFLEPLSDEVKDLRKEGKYFVLTLQSKRQKIGYLAVSGVSEKEREKVMILGHQFALALRRVQLYQEIEQVAITDSLTEVHTRRYLLERLQEEIQRSKARSLKMSFLMIDVDYFKKFNDQYGHLTGDQILRETGFLISENIREIDIAGRYGGEEFCVILPDTDHEGAQFAAERVRKAVENATIKAYDASVKVTVSIGTSTFPDDGKKTDELIDKADWALYRAKKMGRNRVCSFGVYKDEHD
ncbi:MAG TPA: GGDEF domain-containing protein [Candidatus Omnitrophota bacterium]|nr:GGDEF domain-containing protein [Candidatus Omnitrophota bacterium]